MNSKRFDDLVHEIKVTELKEQNAKTRMAQMEAAQATELIDETSRERYAKATWAAHEARQANRDAQAELIIVLQDALAT